MLWCNFLSLRERMPHGALASVFKDLLRNDDKRTALATRALDLVEQNRGATDLTISFLELLWKERDQLDN